tara:strand:- start:2366 stop:3367 length:1002 start_codon:yes stop_codon:yes gene_type:complete
MSGFKPAEPQQARLKVGIYGPPGSGKTFTSLLWAEGLAAARGLKVAYVDTERGTDWYAQEVKNRKVHPAAFDFDAVYTRSLAGVRDAVMNADPNEYGVIVIDSISHLWDAAIEAYEGQKTSADTIPMHAWGQIKKPYKQLLNYLIASPFDVFILGRQKNVFEDDGGQLRKVGVAMRAEGETPHEPHICVRLEQKTDEADTTKSTVLMYVEKDRTGILQGQTIANPNFKTIEVLLPYLGDKQAPMEDEEERKARDAELLAEQESVTRNKADKSNSIMSEFRVAMAACKDIAELGAVAKDLKKKRRYLTEAHRNALRVLYDDMKDQLVKEVAGEV